MHLILSERQHTIRMLSLDSEKLAKLAAKDSQKYLLLSRLGYGVLIIKNPLKSFYWEDLEPVTFTNWYGSEPNTYYYDCTHIRTVSVTT